MAAGHSADKLLDLHDFDLVTLLLMDIPWQKFIASVNDGQYSFCCWVINNQKQFLHSVSVTFDLVTLLLMDISWQNSLLLWMMANIYSLVELMIRNNFYTRGNCDLGHCLSDHTTTRDHPLTKVNSLEVWLSAGILLTWNFLHLRLLQSWPLTPKTNNGHLLPMFQFRTMPFTSYPSETITCHCNFDLWHSDQITKRGHRATDEDHGL